ncbi:MAG: SusE domain-containing protein [Parabacteroides sp.]|nr:SusE domain-containing protein [bacterium]MDY3142945.1 SusE domain-containing protein [Parabacteroides sp.]MDY4552545.1 SusE domain-containing protein [Parabacteroides sp.]MDY5637757.1 SusE domain-containing protein [Parabacteroides sp.]MDY6004912.1 SusE domain-containing protein [Parabacteroides sp.]
MKLFSIKYMLLTVGAALLAACSSDGEVRDLQVTAVQSIYEPADAKSVVLQSSSSASLYFEWEPSLAEDGGAVLYEVVFDKTDGDFSDPLAIIASDNNGAMNHATISHKTLNQIAASAGVESAETGTLKWTVYASKGIFPVKAQEDRTLTITRLAGFAEVPAQLYITGEATEVGGELSKAMQMKKVADGEFEIYMQLTAGQSFQFVSSNAGTPTTYSLQGEKLVEGGTTTVSETGIYRYYVDFNAGSFTSKQVTKVSLFLNWSQREIELAYQGLGVWAVSDYKIEGLSGGDNDDDRYKFRMQSTAGETEWRAINNDSKPTGNESYYYMVEKSNVEQWTNNEIWKNPATDGWSGKTYDVTFSLNPSGEYTHNLVIK